MHIPDGFVDAGTSAAAGVAAIGAIGVCVKRAGAAIDDREVPLAGLAAAFVFSVQMLNFPVASGTSGHLLGGALAAVLVGPWLGPLCVAVVLVVQALLFADGGLSALGLNIVNMSVIGAWGGYLLFLGLRAVLPRARTSIVAASGVAAGLSVPLAALGFTLQYAIGGNDATSVTTVAAAMVGVHLLIGIGEGIITAMTVSAVMAVRPDLVYGARGYTFAPIAGRVPAMTAARG
ncbi:MAG TPA: energy-coupling factor ABC transporter permease [Ilumatobacteraceae bacterium]|nr:energy-coupling factor ABC transporter permease [Ilumatobacteraceae bacterium]